MYEDGFFSLFRETGLGYIARIYIFLYVSKQRIHRKVPSFRTRLSYTACTHGTRAVLVTWAPMGFVSHKHLVNDAQI